MFTIRIIMVLYFIVLSCPCFASLARMDIFVANNGNDLNDGSKVRPFLTLEAARDAVRHAKLERGLEPGEATIWIREGRYEINHTFELDSRDSGLPFAKITYRSFNGEQVIFSGGKRISPSLFKPVNDEKIVNRFVNLAARANVVCADLKSCGITDYGKLSPRGFRRPYVNSGMELFFNKQALQIARWPNSETIPLGKVIDTGSVPRNGDYSNRGGVINFDSNEPLKWAPSEDIWISGTFCWMYADDTVRVATIDKSKKRLTTVQPTLYGFAIAPPNWVHLSYKFLNVLEELDEPGEWYLDRDSGKLYLWPPTDITNAQIEVSFLETPMIAFENVSHVTVAGIIFEVARGLGVYIEGGEGNKIINCTFRNFGTLAICIGKGIKADTMLKHNFTGEPISRQLGSWHEHIYDNADFDRQAGRNHGIENCIVYNTGAGAISLGGGNRKSLTPANNYVINCDIYKFNRLDKSYKAGINIDGVGNIIAHNRIHNSEASAIYLHGNEHIIEYNEIFDVVSGQTGDMGAFYMGRDPSERGNIIRYNLWHHIGIGQETVNVIYLDDGASGTVVYGNIFYKAGSAGWGAVMINAGWDNLVYSNLFIKCPLAVFASAYFKEEWGKSELMEHTKAGGLWRVRLEQAVNYMSEPYKSRYPALKGFFGKDLSQPTGNVFKNNAIYACGRILGERASPKIDVADNIILDENSLPDVNDANLKTMDLSAVFKKAPGLKLLSPSRIGLYTD